MRSTSLALEANCRAWIAVEAEKCCHDYGANNQCKYHKLQKKNEI